MKEQDIVKALECCKLTNEHQCEECLNCPLKEYISSADVVPDSEVERLKRILNSYTLQYGTVRDQQKVIDEAKREVAREIFEEIETKLKPVTMISFFGEPVYDSSVILAEIKKKYLEGSTDGKAD